jgi:hypothetical protein
MTILASANWSEVMWQVDLLITDNKRDKAQPAMTDHGY